VADFLIGSVSEAEDYINQLSTQIAENTKSVITRYRDITESFRAKLIPVARLAVSDSREELSNRIIGIINIGKEYIIRAGFLPKNLSSRLISSSGSFILIRKTSLERDKLDLNNLTINALGNSRKKLAESENRLNILNPVNVLKRGYTITSKNGEIIKKSNDLKPEEIIDTLFSDGSVTSRILPGNQDVKPDLLIQ